MTTVLRRLLFLLLAAAVLFGVTSGCAHKDSAGSAQPQQTGRHMRQAGAAARSSKEPYSSSKPSVSASGAKSGDVAPSQTTTPILSSALTAEQLLASVPVYSGDPYVVVNDNEPFFTDAEKTTLSYETYSPLDELGRCGPVSANIGSDLMPTEPRQSIREVKPSGWVQAQYDFVDGQSLYNRCHLIGFQLTGENANASNLITGTRYLNVEGMLPFENLVADYVRETDNHVLYRVTPIFQGNELVARGVLMEAQSVEDDGDGVSFCVYAYNVQPGIIIDYATGVSRLAEGVGNTADQQGTYILNTNTKKFHTTDCPNGASVSASNRETYHGSRQALVDSGYQPCGQCRP